MRKRKIKEKEIENMSFAVSYALTSYFIEQNHRSPTEEEKRTLTLKSARYILEILDIKK